jgi:hypothetical protein
MAGQKRVSQQTFDDAVRENMDDFGMSREDAIQDAIEQFKMQVSYVCSLVAFDIEKKTVSILVFVT